MVRKILRAVCEMRFVEIGNFTESSEGVSEKVRP